MNLTTGTRAYLPVTMAETRSSSYINESISLLKTITEHHGDSLQEINQQLNTNTQQLNVISLALQKLTEVEERRQKQQSSSPNLQFLTLCLFLCQIYPKM